MCEFVCVFVCVSVSMNKVCIVGSGDWTEYSGLIHLAHPDFALPIEGLSIQNSGRQKKQGLVHFIKFINAGQTEKESILRQLLFVFIKHSLLNCLL